MRISATVNTFHTYITQNLNEQINKERHENAFKDTRMLVWMCVIMLLPYFTVETD